MENTQEVCRPQTAMLKNGFAPITRYSNRISQHTIDLSFHTEYKQNRQAMIKPIITVNVSLESENESPLSSAAQRSASARVPDLSESNLFALEHVCTMMRQMTWKEVGRIHASRADPFLSQAVKNAPYGVFLAASSAANNELKTLSYHFVMRISTEIVATKRLDKIFDRNIEH